MVIKCTRFENSVLLSLWYVTYIYIWIYLAQSVCEHFRTYRKRVICLHIIEQPSFVDYWLLHELIHINLIPFRLSEVKNFFFKYTDIKFIINDFTMYYCISFARFLQGSKKLFQSSVPLFNRRVWILRPFTQVTESLHYKKITLLGRLAPL